MTNVSAPEGADHAVIKRLRRELDETRALAIEVHCALQTTQLALVRVLIAASARREFEEFAIAEITKRWPEAA